MTDTIVRETIKTAETELDDGDVSIQSPTARSKLSGAISTIAFLVVATTCASLIPAPIECQPYQANHLLGQLIELENRPTESLDECAHWFNLNVEYAQLTGVRDSRESELRKRDECDNLERFLEEARDKLANFQRMLAQGSEKQLEYVSTLVNELLDLKYAASVSQEVAAQFEWLKQSDEGVHSGTEQLEQFMLFMQATLGGGQQQSQQVNDHNTNERLVSANGPADALAELDAHLRRLIDREYTMSDAELERLAELGGQLDSLLSSGDIDLSSGRFRYLSGTLDAVRAVLVHKLAEESGRPSATGGVRRHHQPASTQHDSRAAAAAAVAAAGHNQEASVVPNTNNLVADRLSQVSALVGDRLAKLGQTMKFEMPAAEPPAAQRSPPMDNRGQRRASSSAAAAAATASTAPVPAAEVFGHQQPYLPGRQHHQLQQLPPIKRRSAGGVGMH